MHAWGRWPSRCKRHLCSPSPLPGGLPSVWLPMSPTLPITTVSVLTKGHTNCNATCYTRSAAAHVAFLTSRWSLVDSDSLPFRRHGSKAGYSSGVAGVDARRATPPDPRPPRWGLAGCCQLDPSHPTIVTCEVGREGRHAPRPDDVGGGQPRFPGAQRGGDPAASGELRLGHRAPGRGGRRASIPLQALTTLLSALGAFCPFEPRVARICLGNLRCICSDVGNASQGADNTSVRAGGILSVGIPRFLNKSQHFTVHLFRPWRPGSPRGSDGGPRRFTEVVPTPHAYPMFGVTRPLARRKSLFSRPPRPHRPQKCSDNASRNRLEFTEKYPCFSEIRRDNGSHVPENRESPLQKRHRQRIRPCRRGLPRRR